MNLRGWEADEAWLSVVAETLTDWENWNALVPLLVEMAMAHRKVETKEICGKPESGLCRRNVDLTKETGKCLEGIGRFESIASRMFGEIGEIVVVDVLGYDFPGRLAVLFDGNGSESGGVQRA